MEWRISFLAGGIIGAVLARIFPADPPTHEGGGKSKPKELSTDKCVKFDDLGFNPSEGGLKTVLAIFRLPTPIRFSADCFEKEVDFVLNSTRVRLRTPKLKWTEEGSDFPRPWLVSPDNVPRLIEKLNEGSGGGRDDQFDHFGDIHSYNSKGKSVTEGVLQRIILTWEAPVSELSRAKSNSGFHSIQGNPIDIVLQRIQSWWTSVQTWIDILGQNDVNPYPKYGEVIVPADGIIAWCDEVPVQHSDQTVRVVPSPRYATKGVSWALLCQAVACSTNLPSDARILLRAARFFARNPRIAAIDAGSAAEVALSAYVTRKSLTLPPKATLGTRVKHMKDNPTDYPPGLAALSNLQVDLVDVRNDAAHKNIEPTEAHLSLALELVRRLLDELEPVT